MSAAGLARPGPRALAAWGGYLLLALFIAAPFLLSEAPLGVDVMNHLARAHVQAHIGADPDLARLYALRPGLVPYMGLEWLLPPLVRIMPALDAGRVFTVLLLWAMVGAVVALRRAAGAPGLFEPLLMGLVTFNALLAWGFLNYLVGVVGALLGFAAWLGLRGRPWLLRWAAFTAITMLLYAVHLLALALYGAILGAYEVFGRRQPWRTPLRDWLLLGAQFVPALLLWAQLRHSSPPGGTLWHIPTKALAAVSAFVFDGGAGGLDVGLLVAIVCALMMLRLTRSGALRWNRALAAPAAVLFLAGFVAPTRLEGVHFLDLRFPTVAAFLAVAAVSVAPGAWPRVRPAALVLAVAALGQAASATATMRACGRQHGELRAALHALPRGVELAAVLEAEPAPGVPCTRLPMYDHMAQLVVTERSGYSPDFFARVTPVTVRGGRPTDSNPIFAELVAPGMLPRPGHVLWMHLGRRRPVPPGLTPLADGSFFTLYRAD